MADLAVDFLLENLQRLRIYRPHLLEAQNHLQMLENNLRLFKDFLERATEMGLTEDESGRDLIRQINDVVCEAEDIVDAVMSQAAESKLKNHFLRAFQMQAEKLLSSIAKDVEYVGLKVRDIYSEEAWIELASVHINQNEREEFHQARLDDEAEKMIHYLREEAHELDIISIIGVRGSGKTTLAAKVFDDPVIQFEFHIRIWVSISHYLTKKNVFLAILRELTSITEDMYRKSNKELALEIASYLGSRGRFLIVMDDMWTTKDWDGLKIALPKRCNMGKVLITSRFEEVAQNANPRRRPHWVRFLTSEESGLLLLSGAFRKGAQLDDEAEKIICYLREEAHELDIISIIGVRGSGKTTLAAKVFDDPVIQYEFCIRIWVSISHYFTKKNVFLAILRALTSITEDMYCKSNKELAREIASYLGSRGRFLIVMDDVWTIDDWDGLKIAFPKSNNMGKVLITSRFEEVAQNANPKRRPHWVRFLTSKESGLLLRSRAFRKGAIQQNIVVGMEDEAEQIIDYLKEEARELDIISIIGVAGLGKTTLAAKVFDDPRIVSEFRTRIWVCVSQDFTDKKVFLAILRELTSITEDMYRKSNKELARLIASYLGGKGHFLIVMDDVWTTKDWDELKIAFPKSINMGKVLITSRQMEVAWNANPNRHPHWLRLLNKNESWLLLRSVVFGPYVCPDKLEGLGRHIAEQCQGLALAVVVMGGILARKISALNGISSWIEEWIKIATNVDEYPCDYEGLQVEKLILSSYKQLPYHLRTCFHYLRMFPEDFKIPMWKLIRMWISEGFVQRKPDLCLEEVAESYLEDLISRNLVTVDKFNVAGRVKTCRIHDMVLEFCKTEAGYERANFIQEMKKSINGDFEPPIPSVKNYRRLCIHSDVLDFISSKPCGSRVRSFVCFSKDEIILPTENISDIPAGFKLLRVLDANPIKFIRIPSELYHLVHLRYIAMSFINVEVLPAAFSKFWNLETLIFNTTSRTLEVKVDIWEMIHLRHLKTNASATLHKKGRGNEGGENLQTLGTISPESCTKEFFDRAHNLKKLGVRGRLALLLDGKNGSFDSFEKLKNLEKLKLINDLFSDSILEGQLRLPPPYKFPPKLRSLTLSDTFLDWTQMSILGMLDNLVILKLKHKAFMGKHWEVVDGGFRHLEVLHIGRTDLFSWIASDCHFPRLRCIELRNCEELQEVPLGFVDIPSFQLLNLHRCKSAAASSMKIYEAKQEKKQKKRKRTETIRKSGFKLSIFPPEDW